MRPQQQNRRMRGRGNNNRKGPNPLTRSYESNGPDVKIRGTAQQIADKYSALARDAQSSGDRVMAENYLQHAEHYNRLIAAAQAQVQPQQNMRDSRDEGDEEREDRDEQEAVRSDAKPRQGVEDGLGPQPVIEGVPAEVALDRQSSGANGAKSNGHAGANGEEAAPKAPDDNGAEEAPKPAKRTRRSRTKAAESAAPEATDAGKNQPGEENQTAEEATAQG